MTVSIEPEENQAMDGEHLPETPEPDQDGPAPQMGLTM